MPLWQAPDRWLHMGIWDMDPRDPLLRRLEAATVVDALRWAQDDLGLK